MKWLIPLSGLMIFGFGAFLFFKSGGHKSVSIEQASMPATIMLRKAHTGPYHTTVKTIEVVEKFARENNLPCPESFGEYIDDPNVVEHARLKSYGGCILEKMPENLSLPEGFELTQAPEKKAIKALFDGSPAIGPYKVYGKVANYIHENRLESNGPVFEKYKITQGTMTTEYFFPIK